MKFSLLRVGSVIISLSCGGVPGFAQKPKETPAVKRPFYSGPIAHVSPQVKRLLTLQMDAHQSLKRRKWAEAKLKEAIVAHGSLYKTRAPFYADLAEAQYQQGKLPEALQSMKLAFEKGNMVIRRDALRVVRFAELVERYGEPELVEPLWSEAYILSLPLTVGEAAIKATPLNQRKAHVLKLAGQRAELEHDVERANQLYEQAARLDLQK